jgi:hypothetical protein
MLWAALMLMLEMDWDGGVEAGGGGFDVRGGARERTKEGREAAGGRGGGGNSNLLLNASCDFPQSRSRQSRDPPRQLPLLSIPPCLPPHKRLHTLFLRLSARATRLLISCFALQRPRH